MFSCRSQLRSHLKQTAGAGPQLGRDTAGADTSCGVCSAHQPGSREMLVDHIRASHTVFKEVEYFLFYNFKYFSNFSAVVRPTLTTSRDRRQRPRHVPQKGRQSNLKWRIQLLTMALWTKRKLLLVTLKMT